MRKSLKIFFSLVIVIGILAIVVLYNPVLLNDVTDAISKIKNVATGQSNIQNIAADVKQQLFPTPLRATSTPVSDTSTLSRIGVIALTNQERRKQGVKTLTENAKLDAAATAKMNDMFKQQYFEHVSPEGVGPGTVANNAGYEYILEGENLALGNFADDSALVAAWMASPGHRANILNSRFEEIGVAVGVGIFQGKKEWLAVQEFGEPASDCPAISDTLKTKITADKASVDAMSADLSQKKQQLDAMHPTTPQEQNEYNQQADSYNAEVATYNSLRANLQSEIATYNAEVVAFNACIKG